MTVTDTRGLQRDVPVRVAYYAGTIADRITLALTGDPASAEFVRERSRARGQKRGVTATRRPGRRHLRRRPRPRLTRPGRRRLVRRSGADSEPRRLGSRRLDPRRRAERCGAAHLARLAHGERLSRALDRERHPLHRRSASRSNRRAFSTSTTTRPDNPTGGSFCAPRIFRASLRSCSSLAVAAARRRTRWMSAIPQRSGFWSTSCRIKGGCLTLAGNSSTVYRRAGSARR